MEKWAKNLYTQKSKRVGGRLKKLVKFGNKKVLCVEPGDRRPRTGVDAQKGKPKPVTEGLDPKRRKALHFEPKNLFLRKEKVKQQAVKSTQW